MKFRKKPVVIDAIQFTGLNIQDIEKFTGQRIAAQLVELYAKIANR
jgi:hypothetical protein